MERSFILCIGAPIYTFQLPCNCATPVRYSMGVVFRAGSWACPSLYLLTRPTLCSYSWGLHNEFTCFGFIFLLVSRPSARRNLTMEVANTVHDLLPLTSCDRRSSWCSGCIIWYRRRFALRHMPCVGSLLGRDARVTQRGPAWGPATAVGPVYASPRTGPPVSIHSRSARHMHTVCTKTSRCVGDIFPSLLSDRAGRLTSTRD